MASQNAARPRDDCRAWAARDNHLVGDFDTKTQALRPRHADSPFRRTKTRAELVDGLEFFASGPGGGDERDHRHRDPAVTKACSIA